VIGEPGRINRLAPGSGGKECKKYKWNNLHEVRNIENQFKIIPFPNKLANHIPTLTNSFAAKPIHFGRYRITYNTPVYATQHAVPGNGLPQGFFKYEGYYGIPGRFGY
jgi:hypothetical protein